MTIYCPFCGYPVLSSQESVAGGGGDVFHKGCAEQLEENCKKFIELWKKRD